MRDPERIGRIAFIRYKGGARGEKVLDDRSEGEPLAVVIGAGNIPRGIENILYELEVGESRQVEIPCELGYGEYNLNAVQWYPRAVIERGYDLKVGSVLTWTNPDDHSVIPASVVEETADNVRIDLNHPFAGKTLSYWVELVDLK
jgi:FKBP-type peptidyl-prolyl cis-trans isomerase 2